MNIFPIPAFSDNYLWLLSDGHDAAIVDPGDAAPVLRELDARGLQLRAILITHWHPDHIGGINKLLEKFPVPVYGPRAEKAKIPQLTQLLGEGDTIIVLGKPFEVMEVPGHTLGHITYRQGENLFCGDTLFSAGCGRLFEGTPAQMHHSLSRLKALPDATQVFCTHEYTTSNLAFALAVEPDNIALQAHAQKVKQLRVQNQPSVPTTIGLEKAINPFLRGGVEAVQKSAEARAGRELNSETEIFTTLRSWKDQFKG